MRILRLICVAVLAAGLCSCGKPAPEPPHEASQSSSSYRLSSYVVTSPAFSDGVLFVSAGDGRIRALDAATGQTKWVAETGGWINSSPAVANGVVYVGSSDEKMHALRADNGNKIWEYKASTRIEGSPEVADGKVFFSDNKDFLALAADTGALVWKCPINARAISRPKVEGGIVFFTIIDGRVMALDANTGAPRWQKARYDVVARLTTRQDQAELVVWLHNNGDTSERLKLVVKGSQGDLVSSDVEAANGDTQKTYTVTQAALDKAGGNLQLLLLDGKGGTLLSQEIKVLTPSPQ